MANPFSTLVNRIWDYVGPRKLEPAASPAAGWTRQLSPRPQTQTRHEFYELEQAIQDCDNGNLKRAGQICRSLRGDGALAGILSTRMDGLVQLPRFIEGPVDALNGQLLAEFDFAFPAAELALMMGDGRLLGIMCGEFIEPVPGYPVLVRCDPEFIYYIASEDLWFYQSNTQGLIPIHPGDGRWVLALPGGNSQPWSHSLWKGLAKSYISKDHAMMLRENFCQGLANPAKVLTSSVASTEEERAEMLRQVSQWAVNSGFVLPQGWQASLLAASTTTADVFQQAIDTADLHIKLAISGETVTGDGGAGFSNSAIHASIRSDLIQSDANALASMLNQQAIPVWANERFGAGFIEYAPQVRWDTKPPADLVKEAAASNQMALAAKAWNDAFAAAGTGQQVDLVSLARGLKLPLIAAPKALPAAPEADTQEAFAIPLVRRLRQVT